MVVRAGGRAEQVKGGPHGQDGPPRTGRPHGHDRGGGVTDTAPQGGEGTHPGKRVL